MSWGDDDVLYSVEKESLTMISLCQISYDIELTMKNRPKKYPEVMNPQGPGRGGIPLSCMR